MCNLKIIRILVRRWLNPSFIFLLFHTINCLIAI